MYWKIFSEETNVLGKKFKQTGQIQRNKNKLILSLLGNGYTWQIFGNFTQETTFVTSCLLSCALIPLLKGSILKEK